jgi:hypothetical protein
VTVVQGDQPTGSERDDLVFGTGRTDEETLEYLRGLSRTFDTAFRVPGTDFRVGLDPILGLLPVVGDTPGAVVSAYIVAEAARLGAPRETLGRMLVVLVVDAVFGSLPLVGDVFDAWWKANARNVALLESALDGPTRATRDRRFLFGVGVAVVVALLAAGAGVALAAAWLVGRFGLV